MTVLEGFIGAIAFPAEMGCLFAVWQWRARNSPAWLFLGGALAGLVIVACAVQPAILRPSMILGMFGMYIFSGFAWAWLVDGQGSATWRAGEVGLVFAAVALFALAIDLAAY
jgi:drug/metabolite transporter superfamily protein YnfA